MRVLSITCVKKLILILTFCFLTLLRIAASCQTSYALELPKPMAMHPNCYLKDNLYSNVYQEKHANITTLFNYLTELCTDSHRLIIFKMKDTKFAKYRIDNVLHDTLHLANSRINYDIRMTKKNIMRLKRHLLEEAFIELI